MGRTRKGEATVRRIALFFFVSLFIVEVAYSFDNEESHRMITDKAISASTLSLYLQNTIGLKDGASSIIKDNKTVSWWLSEGSYLEDLPPCRASNHFHNPLLPWSESYMSDDTTSLGLAIRVYCGSTGWPYADRKSAVIWAKGNGMGWSNARTYFYTALTSESNTDRETNFAKTFQALGQVIHLLQDMAVPSHVRNDFTSHLVFGGINSTNYNDVSKWYIQPFEFYIKNKPYLITSASSAVSLARLTDYWDTDQYTKNTNPSILTNPGLAEYANSNFLSEETIFKGILDSAHSFPYPAWSSVMEYDEVIDPAKGTVRTYLKKTKDGETVNHLAAGKWFYKYLPSFLKNSGLKLDEQVHADYASLLLPRAVGYSAGLLNYFFRGSIDMVRDTENDACKYVVYNFSNENMEGTFGLYYDDASGNRNNVASGDLTANAGSPSNPITLDITDEEKEKSKYILVFQGTMGNEAGAVVADAKVTPFTSSCGTELTITGPDTVSQDNSEQFETTGCTGCEDDVNWEVSGEGATIDKDGLLTVDKTACGGTLIITAKCPICETETTKTITIPDSITISGPDSNNCYTASGGAGSYTWDISKGSIDSNGCVTTTTGQCGITTVTITDANGCKTTTTVTLPDTLTITGPEAPVDGSCYITTGGTEPYTWDITKGTIDEKGCVGLTGQCGTATVKAKDINECTGKKEVNIPAVPLDISGADMIAKNSSETYSASGCSKAVSWSVAGKGATIEPLENAGALLKTDETACREITITAKCPDCNTEASKNVSVSDTCGTLTISGSDTTVKASTRQYTMNGCCGEQKWSVSGAGASISSALDF